MCWDCQFSSFSCCVKCLPNSKLCSRRPSIIVSYFLLEIGCPEEHPFWSPQRFVCFWKSCCCINRLNLWSLTYDCSSFCCACLCRGLCHYLSIRSHVLRVELCSFLCSFLQSLSSFLGDFFAWHCRGRFNCCAVLVYGGLLCWRWCAGMQIVSFSCCQTIGSIARSCRIILQGRAFCRSSFHSSSRRTRSHSCSIRLHSCNLVQPGCFSRHKDLVA